MITTPTQNTDNLYAKFSKVDYSSPSNYLVNAYGRPIEYYSKEDDIKKQNRKKIYKISAFAATAVSIAAIITALIKSKALSGKFKITIPKKPEDIPLLGKISNIMTNSVNVKDDYFKKFTQNEKCKKIPFFGYLEKFADKLTEFNKSMVRTAQKTNYQKAYDKAVSLGVDPKELQTYENLFSSLDKVLKEKLNEKGNRVTDNLINKSFFKKMSSGVIANDKIIPDALAVSKKTVINPSWNSVQQKAVEEFNMQHDKTFNILTAKLRDLNCGSAPTDFLTIISSVLGLSIAAAAADTKEDRKSICINLGIPLTATLISTTYGTLKALSGPKSLILGLVAGQLASICAKTVDSIVKKRAEKNNNSKQI